MPVEWIISVLAFVTATMCSLLAYIWVRTVKGLEKDIDSVNERVSNVKKHYLPRLEAEARLDTVLQQVNNLQATTENLKEEIHRHNKAVGELLIEIRNENIRRAEH